MNKQNSGKKKESNMEENNKNNKDLKKVISSFEKRTQQITDEQREARERFVVALSELSRQYDLSREWSEKNTEELKNFLEKLTKPEETDELQNTLSNISKNLEKLPQGFENTQKLIESIENLFKDFSDQLREQQTATSQMKDSLSEIRNSFSEAMDILFKTNNSLSNTKDTLESFISTFNESIMQLSKSFAEANTESLAKIESFATDLFNKIDELNTSLIDTSSKLKDSIAPLFEKMENAFLESFEKQVLKSGEIQKELQTLTDITTDLKDIFNTISNNIVTLSKKQDVVSAVIDKRGEGIEEKITLLKTTIDKLAEISTEGSAGIKKAISELSITFENQFKSLENILQKMIKKERRRKKKR